MLHQRLHQYTQPNTLNFDIYLHLNDISTADTILCKINGILTPYPVYNNFRRSIAELLSHKPTAMLNEQITNHYIMNTSDDLCSNRKFKTDFTLMEHFGW